MVAVASLVLILVLGARAQQLSQTSPSQPNLRVAGQGVPASGQELQTTPGQSTIRSFVSVVSTPVVVRNAKGELVMDLTEKDLRVFDNGVQQTLETFEMGGAPLSLVIIVENSSRIRALLPDLRRAGILFTQTLLGKDGEAAVMGFNDEVTMLLDFTSDDSAIEKAFVDLQPGTSGANLYDALSKAVQMLRNLSPSRRRVIVTLAEARDTGSEGKLDQMVREAQVANITIYSVGLSTIAAEFYAPPQQAAPLRATPPGTFGLPAIPGAMHSATMEHFRGGNIDLGGLVRPIWAFVVWKPPLEAAVAATGGSYRSTDPDNSVEAAIDKIGGELNAQYTLSYRRVGSEMPGYHEIKVEVVGRRALKVRARSGYYLLQP